MNRSSGEDSLVKVGTDGSQVRVCDPGAQQDWDQRWAALPGWSAFHGSGWAEVLRSTYHFSPCYLELRTPQGQTSLLPLMECRSLLRGRRGVSLPFTDACPALCAEPAHAEVLLEAALELARRRGWRYVELRGNDSSSRHPRASIAYCEHVLDLPDDEAALFARFKPELRTAIRKARKSGLRVEIGTDHRLLQEFIALHATTRRRQGVPIQPSVFFENVQRHLLDRQAGRVVIARSGDKPLAGAVFLQTKDTAIFKYGASDFTGLESRPNNLVIWEALRWYVQQGFRSLHMGRTSSSNEGLRRFKRAWGASERVLPYYRLAANRGTVLPAADHSSGWATALFRRLPVPVLRTIGRLFYRQMD